MEISINNVKTRGKKRQMKMESWSDSTPTKSKYFAKSVENKNIEYKTDNKLFKMENELLNVETDLKNELLGDINKFIKIKSEIIPKNTKTEKNTSPLIINQSEISYTDTDPLSQSKMPLNWVIQLDNIRKMRSNLDAPVDTMGCDLLYDPLSSPKDQRFQKLLALMLSSQTKDQVTSEAVKRLLEIGCGSCEGILQTSVDTLSQSIKPVSFYKTKAVHIRKAADMLFKNYHGDIPSSVAELCQLPGVGPKMAHLAMKCAWGKITGIAVDTHVHRISNRLGWVECKTPEKTMVELQEWLPRAYWSEVNHLLVGFGQQICSAVKPRCGECLNQNKCLFYNKKGMEGGKEKKKRIKNDG